MKTFNSISFFVFILFAVMSIPPWALVLSYYGEPYQIGALIVQIVGLAGLIWLIIMLD